MGAQIIHGHCMRVLTRFRVPQSGPEEDTGTGCSLGATGIELQTCRGFADRAFLGPGVKRPPWGRLA